MKFVAYLEQSSGCDYTIGCGKILIKLDADTYEEAEDKLKYIIRDEYSYDEGMLSKVTLYEVNRDIAIDIDRIYFELSEEKRAEEDIENERKEREELERLRKKYKK